MKEDECSFFPSCVGCVTYITGNPVAMASLVQNAGGAGLIISPDFSDLHVSNHGVLIKKKIEERRKA